MSLDWRGRGPWAANRLERRLVWMLGSPRTGSTWLAGLLAEVNDIVALDEPQIGVHLAPFSPDVLGTPARAFRPEQMRLNEVRAGSPAYFFSEAYRTTWTPPLRRLVLARLAAEVGSRRGWVLVKEPNGSQAADLLFAALPAARLLFLVRDGRDVVDSQLDAAKPGAWLDVIGGGYAMSPEDRLRFVEERAYRWVARTRVVSSVYDELPVQRRLLVRYEDLLTDTAAEMSRLLRWLGVPEPTDLDSIVAGRSFSALERSGSGEFARAASPGLWRTNLTEEEQAVLSTVMGEALQTLGYDA